MRHFSIEIGAVSDRGLVRKQNQDALGYFKPVEPDLLESKGCLFIVADGMGGHVGGDIASEYSVQETLTAYYAHPSENTATALESAIQAAHEVVREGAEQQDTPRSMGTTLVTAVVRGSQLLVANVGDSPAYLIREGTRTELSEAHSWVGIAVSQGLLTPEEATTHPNRNIITRYVGMADELEIYVSSRLELKAQDTLVLCTDGLSNMVSQEEMAEISADRTSSAQEAAERLLELARERGAPDNVTTIIVHID
jgi:protein phosphatase